jgi:hypothetical protein
MINVKNVQMNLIHHVYLAILHKENSIKGNAIQ